MHAARGGRWRRLALTALSAMLVVAVLVAWSRYETGDGTAAPEPGRVTVPRTPAPPDAEAQELPERSAGMTPRRYSRPPDVVTRVRPRGPSGGDGPEATPEPVLHGTGEFVVAAGGSDVVGEGSVRRFLVEVEDGTRLDPDVVAEEVEDVLFDDRGWSADPRYALQRVDEGPVDFRVTLASPDTVDRECRPMQTRGRFSCWNGTRAMLNLWRWLEGAEAYGGDLDGYRRYLVSHEVGHALGHGHTGCPGPGEPAPTMMQQSIGVGACRPNPWPLPDR